MMQARVENRLAEIRKGRGVRTSDLARRVIQGVTSSTAARRL